MLNISKVYRGNSLSHDLVRTTVVHAVEPEGVHLAEVEVLANYVIELRDFGSYGGPVWILIEGEWPVMHDGLIVVRCVLVCDVVIVVFVEVMLHSCGR